MFSLQIVDSDAFLDMPASSQLLYFHLSMRADDDGFISNPKKILRMIGSGEDDLKVLLAKRFILDFQSGVVVIKHWRIHNYIQNDRYHETKYIEEKNGLIVKGNGAYTECIQSVTETDTEVRLGKVRLGKARLEKEEKFLVASAPTPKQEAVRFFQIVSEEGSDFESIIQEICASSRASPDLIRRELKKFSSYWTEPTPAGNKQFWETKKTFEVKRRLVTWLGNIKQFSGSKENISKYIPGIV